jgi:hypothetical protein
MKIKTLVVPVPEAGQLMEALDLIAVGLLRARSAVHVDANPPASVYSVVHPTDAEVRS